MVRHQTSPPPHGHTLKRGKNLLITFDHTPEKNQAGGKTCFRLKQTPVLLLSFQPPK